MTKNDSGASLPLVQLPEFEGPLDLLLDEVRRQNVAIENIAMAPIVARFLEYVRSASERHLNLDIEWLHMAATLIHWKSRALLPQELTGDPQKNLIRDELVRQLLAYRKDAADELARRRSVEETRFSRATAIEHELRNESSPANPEEPSFVSVWDLIQQARDLARWIEQQREDRHRWCESFGVEDNVTVNEMMDYIRDRLATEDGGLDGIGLLESQDPGVRRSCLFLAMLEMARERQIEIQQNEVFGPMWLHQIPHPNTCNYAATSE